MTNTLTFKCEKRTFKQYIDSFKENNPQIPTFLIDYWNGDEESEEEDDSNVDCIEIIVYLPCVKM